MPRRTLILPNAPLKSIDTSGLTEIRNDDYRLIGDTTSDIPVVTGTQKFLTRTARHTYLTDGHVARVCRDIEHLPESGEVLHLILDGSYPLWSFIPSTLRLSGVGIDRLQIATLGFSRDNVAQLCQLIDAGEIVGDRTSILASHYFRHTNSEIYDPAKIVLAERGAALNHHRTHCKIINARLADGRTYTVESSANMRSCKNIEQASIFSDAGLYDFHATWIGKVMAEGGDDALA